MKEITAYLKQQCGWSRGVREVLAKYGLIYDEKQIHIAENYQEMVEKTGQPLQPCVQIDDVMLVDVSGEELQGYLLEHGYEQVDVDPNVPLDRSCSDEEHKEMERQNSVIQPTTGGSKPHIPIKDTGFYGAR